MLHFRTVAPGTLQLLRSICALPDLSGFSLAGGTALALQMGHRISVDLDFFGKQEFTTDEILDLLKDFKPISIVTQSKNILVLNVQNVKVDFVNYQYPLISELIMGENIRLHSIPDIAAMKLAAIAGRGRKRDFYDLYFLLQKFPLSMIIDFYNQKYPDGSEMMVARSLTFFEDANEDESPRLLEDVVSWNEVKEVILEQVKTMYST